MLPLLPNGSRTLGAPSEDDVKWASDSARERLARACVGGALASKPKPSGRSNPRKRREALLKRALAAQYATPAAAESGLVAHLLATADQLLVNVDVDPWLGMQAAGGISSGQNVFGKALMALRAELREQ